MTRNKAAILLPVIQAWAEGRVIQCRLAGSCAPWIDVLYEEAVFDTRATEWRLKPTPLECWVRPGAGPHAWVVCGEGEPGARRMREVL